MRILPKVRARSRRTGAPRPASLAGGGAAALVAAALWGPAQSPPLSPGPTVLACPHGGGAALVVIEPGGGRRVGWPALPAACLADSTSSCDDTARPSPLSFQAPGTRGPGAACVDVTADREGIRAALRSDEQVRRDRWAVARRVGSDG